MLYNADRPRDQLDAGLFWSALLLLAFGLVMVYSSSIAMAEAEKISGYNPQYFLIRHAIYLAMAAVAGIIIYQVPLAVWQRFAPVLFLGAAVLLLLVLIPGVGREVNGSRRWIPLGVMTMQPSELMKLCAVLYAADYTVRKAAFMHDFKKGFLPLFGVMVLIAGLLLREPDFGALVVITAIAMAILFLGGLDKKIFIALIGLLAVAFAVLIKTSPYRLQRLLGFMDPWSDPFGKGYQLSHSLIAFGRGEWLGVGLGASVEKLFYLPEAHTDFILAVIGEELGFVGVCAVIGIYAFLIYRIFAIGRNAMMREKYFAALVAQGIGVWLAVQGFINMGVNMGIMPTKGLTLPFLSYGGTGILVNCMAIGLLLRINHENHAVASRSSNAAGSVNVMRSSRAGRRARA